MVLGQHPSNCITSKDNPPFKHGLLHHSNEIGELSGVLGAQLVQKTGDTGRWGKTGGAGQVLQNVGGTVIKPLLALNTWGIGNKMFSVDYV